MGKQNRPTVMNHRDNAGLGRTYSEDAVIRRLAFATQGE